MDLNVVNQILDSYLKERSLTLFSVEMVKEFGYNILRVTIDKEGGIDVDTLAEVNEYLSERIDKYDSDMPEYMLEVSSPGCEKPLRNEEEIKSSIGEYVHVEIADKVYEGVLVDFADGNIILKVNCKGQFRKATLAYNEGTSIRLAVKI